MSILKSINPANEQMFAEFKQMSLAEVKQIILESSKTQNQWAELEIQNRIQVISKVKKMIFDNKRQYAETITSDMGKPIL